MSTKRKTTVDLSTDAQQQLNHSVSVLRMSGHKILSRQVLEYGISLANEAIMKAIVANDCMPLTENNHLAIQIHQILNKTLFYTKLSKEVIQQYLLAEDGSIGTLHQIHSHVAGLQLNKRVSHLNRNPEILASKSPMNKILHKLDLQAANPNQPTIPRSYK